MNAVFEPKGHDDPILSTGEFSAADTQAQPSAKQRQNDLHNVFLEFAQFGTRANAKSMDIFRFMKLCRECQLLPKPSDASSIDLVFYKVHALFTLCCMA